MARVKGVYQPITNHNDLTNRGNVGHSSIDLRTSGYVSGGPPTWQSVSTCRIPSGHRAIDPDTGALLTAGANYDCVLSAAGALGLDTGSEAVSTWYYLWLCSGASGTTGIWSASATAPTLPAGYAVNKARVGGAWRNNAGSDLLRAWHVVSAGRTVVTQAAPVTAQSGSVGAAATLVDLAAMVPPGATRAYVQMVMMAWNNTANQSETMYTLAYASASPTTEFALRCTVYHPTAGENLMCSAEGMVPLQSPQTIWAANVTSGGTPNWSSLTWDVLGWEST